MTVAYEMSHLERLEAEAVQIIREVAATIEKPALLFSGGKDSVVMLHLAVKAFWPAPVPFPVMHVDTSQNFDEVIEFRDRTVDRYGLRLIVERDGMLLAVNRFIEPAGDEVPFEASVRFRTIGDATCTGCVESTAATAEDVVAEVAAARITERGATRADDRISEAGMEDRKKEGYF